MKIMSRSNRTFLSLAASAITLLFLAAPGRVSANSGTTTTVTAVGKKQSPPQIKKEDVQLFQGKERLQVADWKRGETLFLAILIDDSLDQQVASQ